MYKKEILDLFPIKAMVTQEILDEANVFEIQSCIGALTLKSVLPDKLKKVVTWGAYSGFLFENSIHSIDFGISKIQIITKEEINFMELEEPTEITFILSI